MYIFIFNVIIDVIGFVYCHITWISFVSSAFCCFFAALFKVNKILFSVFYFIFSIEFLFIPLLTILFSSFSRANRMHS